MSVDPSSISMPPSADSPDSEPGPSRKRQRTAASSEERKEARAHRNRIAAQNSRDRRKAQYVFLERRVSELEEENRQLRAGLVAAPSKSDPLKVEEQKRDKANERENEELRERIRTLEKGWDAVMKALAAQGLSTGTAPPDSQSAQPTSPHTSTPAFAAPPNQQPAESTASPTFLEPTMTFPVSPAPSHNSLDFDFDLESSSSFMSSPVDTPMAEDLDSTRHLAAGGLELSLALPVIDSDDSSAPEEAAIDDATMEDLFREILAPSPRLTSASLPFDASSGPHFEAVPSGATPPAAFSPQVTTDSILGLEELVGAGMDEVKGDTRIWTNELEVDMLEVDRILELLPAASAAFQHNLEDLGLWGDLENMTGGESALVGVF